MKRLLAMFTILLAVGCGPTNDALVTDEGYDTASEDDAFMESTLACESTANCNNCVYYAGCRAPGLKKFNLTSWSQKLAARNSDNGSPGCVAMIDTGSYYGHVAYVTKVTHNPHHVWIDEGNWNGRCGSRDGTKSQLKIAGYWCP